MNLPVLQPAFPFPCGNAGTTRNIDNTEKATTTFLSFDIVKSSPLVRLTSRAFVHCRAPHDTLLAELALAGTDTTFKRPRLKEGKKRMSRRRLTTSGGNTAPKTRLCQGL